MLAMLEKLIGEIEALLHQLRIKVDVVLVGLSELLLPIRHIRFNSETNLRLLS